MEDYMNNHPAAKIKRHPQQLIERIVISQIFTRGVELQNENDLSV